MNGDMKKFYTAIIATIVLFAAGCSVTQEMKENASFEGLVKVYIEEPVGTREIFSQTGNYAELDATLKSSIAAYLKTKGFDCVADKSDAQIIFRPLWNVSYLQPETEQARSITSSSQPIGIGTSTAAANSYATLEIQAILPSSGDIWSWRGFSPSHISAADCTTANIKRQVAWCLEYFPPDKYPSRLETIKKEKRETKIREEENPFKEVLIKEREKREAAAK